MAWNLVSVNNNQNAVNGRNNGRRPMIFLCKKVSYKYGHKYTKLPVYTDIMNMPAQS